VALSLKSVLGPAMLSRNLGFLLEAEAAKIEGGFGARSQR